MRVLVGTIGQSILATDDGESWSRIGPNQGFHSDAIVRTLVNDPAQPEVLWAGTDQGILRSEDGGRKWQNLGGLLAGRTVWRIALHPSDPQVIYAGTGTPSTPGIFKSEDGGATWRALPVDIAEDCPNVGVPRITDIAIDPQDPNNMWASVEVDGMRYSRDGGESWSRISGAIKNPDGHAAVVTSGPPKSVFLTVNNEIHISRDNGENWQAVGVKQRFPWTHVRDVVFDAADPCSAWAAIGDFTPGTTGTLMHTCDAGDTWERVDMPVQPNSAMWVVRTQPDDPNLIFAASRYGYLYRSDDRGKSWAKLAREFSEVSSVAWVPG